MPQRRTRAPFGSRFRPLAEYLAARDDAEVVLAFAEIEAIIGKPLSVSATAMPSMWTWPEYAHVRTWLAEGWRAHLEQRDHAVRFTRDAGGEGDE